jgi:hypothetical protein
MEELEREEFRGFYPKTGISREFLRNSEVRCSWGVTQRFVLRVYDPKKTGA